MGSTGTDTDKSVCARAVLVTGPGDGMTNMLATFLTFGCGASSALAVFSLMGNGKKIEGYFLCGVWVVGALRCPVLVFARVCKALHTKRQDTKALCQGGAAARARAPLVVWLLGGLGAGGG